MARKTSFYYSFLVLPSEQRQAITAVWDFCRAVDDAVDEPFGGKGTEREADGSKSDSELEETLRESVRFWREELTRCYEGRTPETPQGERLQPAIARFDLPRKAFEDVIDGVAMDISTVRYQTFADLLEYCHRVASAVGMICVKIFGCRGGDAREYALNLGVALQLTNIIRDVKDDLDRGRVYLPLEDLAAVGCTFEELAARRQSPPVRRLIEFECRRAREYYDLAVRSRPVEDRKRLIAAEIMRAVYFETLKRIERSGYDVFAENIRVPRARQAFIALKQWLWLT
jgi:phytoene synthase